MTVEKCHENIKRKKSSDRTHTDTRYRHRHIGTTYEDCCCGSVGFFTCMKPKVEEILGVLALLSNSFFFHFEKLNRCYSF